MPSRNVQTMPQNQKENDYLNIKFIIDNAFHSRICYNLFRASHTLCWASRIHLLLARQGKLVELVLKLMLVPVNFNNIIELFSPQYNSHGIVY